MSGMLKRNDVNCIYSEKIPIDKERYVLMTSLLLDHPNHGFTTIYAKYLYGILVILKCSSSDIKFFYDMLVWLHWILNIFRYSWNLISITQVSHCLFVYTDATCKLKYKQTNQTHFQF